MTRIPGPGAESVSLGFRDSGNRAGSSVAGTGFRRRHPFHRLAKTNGCRRSSRATPSRAKSLWRFALGLYISNLAVVDETREQFQVEGYFTVGWDDPRLALPEASRVTGHLRKLNPDDLWTPPLETANMISHRRNSFELTADDSGHLRYVERTDTTVSAYYSLRKFPFDSQTLEFEIEPFMPAAREFTFASRPQVRRAAIRRPLRAWRLGQSKPCRYTTRQVEGRSGMPVRSQALFQVIIRRHSGFYIWKIFLP
jgi:hypothetical protein